MYNINVFRCGFDIPLHLFFFLSPFFCISMINDFSSVQIFRLMALGYRVTLQLVNDMLPVDKIILTAIVNCMN